MLENNGSNIPDRIRSGLLAMMAERPIYKIKIKELCAFTGIGRSTFYVYYDSIYAVLQEIEDDFFEALSNVKRLSPDHFKTDADIKNTGVRLMSFFKDNLDLINILTGPYGDLRFRNTLMNEIEKQLYRTFPDLAKDEHLFKEACSYIANGEIAMFSRWAANPSGYSAEQLSEIYLGFANAIIMQVKKTL